MKKQAEAYLPTLFGNFRILVYADAPDELMPHIALVHEDFDYRKVVTIRVHSECMTGDIFGSKKCDCGEQLNAALQMISEQKGADRKSTRLNSSHRNTSRMPSSA